MLSLEWVYWFSRFVGLTMQLDAGPMFGFGFDTSHPLSKDLRHVDWGNVLPFGRLSAALLRKGSFGNDSPVGSQCTQRNLTGLPVRSTERRLLGGDPDSRDREVRGTGQTMRGWSWLVLWAFVAPSSVLASNGRQSDDDEAAGPTRKIAGWFQPPPFQRLVDLELIAPGFPDAIGLCAEVNPGYFVSLEGCAGAVFLAASVSVAVKSRFLHYVHFEEETRADGALRYRGFEFGMGPGIGVRSLTTFGFAGSASSGSTSGVTVDAMLSFEWVYWFARFAGLTMQLDAGPMFGFDGNSATSKDLRHIDLSKVSPFGRLSIGIAF